MPITDASHIIKEVNTLANTWRSRQAAMKKSYNTIRLVNDLKQEKMESVIGSDPRTSFNMARWLLTPRTPIFAVDTEFLGEEESAFVGGVEDLCNREYLKAVRKTGGSLYGRLDQRLLSYMLTTGWYAVVSMPTEDGWRWGVWNPAGVFPDYDSEGNLVRVARRYTVSARDANSKVRMEEWSAPSIPWTSRSVTVYNLWWMDWSIEKQEYVAWYGAVVGTHLVYPPRPTEFRTLPVEVAPVAGLPDDGTITSDDAWRAEIGASLVDPIADVQKNYDKMLTYMQQLLRDTANPRWVEKVRGNSVLDPEKLFMRGAVFSIEPGEDIFPIPTPPLPPEMRSHQFDLRGQIQRGLFSDLSFGNVTQQVSAFLITQVTSANQQILDPFSTGLSTVLGNLATKNLAHMRLWGLEPQVFKGLPDELIVAFKYDITIPGDFANRAQTARLLNPEFRLSTLTLMELLIPEVRNAIIEKGQLQAEDALSNPVTKQVLTIWQLQRAAAEARKANDTQFASALERAAAMMESISFDQGNNTKALPSGNESGLPPNILELIGASQ
jgi:hypothetical protein